MLGDIFNFILLLGLIGLFFWWLLRKVSYSPGVEAPVVKDKTYDDLLKDERWKETRERILERDGHKCVWCGRKKGLQIHHKYYNRYPDGSMAEPWDYPDDAFMTLCGGCHKKYHEKYRVKTYYRRRKEHYH